MGNHLSTMAATRLVVYVALLVALLCALSCAKANEEHPHELTDQSDLLPDVGASVGRRGGPKSGAMLSSMGSFTMTGPNRAGNDEEVQDEVELGSSQRWWNPFKLSTMVPLDTMVAGVKALLTNNGCPVPLRNANWKIGAPEIPKGHEWVTGLEWKQIMNDHTGTCYGGATICDACVNATDCCDNRMVKRHFICAQVSFEECPEKEAVKLLPSISAGYVRLEANSMKRLAELYASQTLTLSLTLMDRVANHVQNCLWKTYVGKQTAAGKRIKCVSAAVRRRTKQSTKQPTRRPTANTRRRRRTSSTRHRRRRRN